MSIAVIVPTFGAPDWCDIAAEYALPSIEAQTSRPDELIAEHGTTLQAARNEGAALARSEWLCFLDADDRLDPGYIAAMRHAIDRGEGDRLLTPAVERGKLSAALIEPRRSIWHGNWFVIGTLIPRTLFLECEGFWDERGWEDWSLWIRAIELGALPVAVPDAIYQASPSSGRNSVVRPYALGRDIRERNRTWLAARSAIASPFALADATMRDAYGFQRESA